jgi:Tfp pilus assembly protein PilV
MGLLDVLLAIIIFVVGMLALASLQGNLTRSSADANARTVGINIAEENIERLRQFQGLWAEVGKFTYQDIPGERHQQHR